MPGKVCQGRVLPCNIDGPGLLVHPPDGDYVVPLRAGERRGVQQELLGAQPAFEGLQLLRTLIVEGDNGVLGESPGRLLQVPSLENDLEVVESVERGVGARCPPVDYRIQPRDLEVPVEGVDLRARPAEVRDLFGPGVPPRDVHHARLLVHLPGDDAVLKLGATELLCMQQEVLGACAALIHVLLASAEVVEADDGVLREGLSGGVQVPRLLHPLKVAEGRQGGIGGRDPPVHQRIEPHDLVVAVKYVHLSAGTAEA
mmetsp:Transcript_6677/g.20291  ORF Transcript_6677/g.20291 Transcript_6677/m.20291 type:complete len:257 (-) Transcript_6677:672-1442(-)